MGSTKGRHIDRGMGSTIRQSAVWGRPRRPRDDKERDRLLFELLGRYLMKLRNACLVVMLLATSCDVAEEIRGETIYSEASQTFPSEIILTKDGGGATTPDIYRVYARN